MAEKIDPQQYASGRPYDYLNQMQLMLADKKHPHRQYLHPHERQFLTNQSQGPQPSTRPAAPQGSQSGIMNALQKVIINPLKMNLGMMETPRQENMRLNSESILADRARQWREDQNLALAKERIFTNYEKLTNQQKILIGSASTMEELHGVLEKVVTPASPEQLAGLPSGSRGHIYPFTGQFTPGYTPDVGEDQKVIRDAENDISEAGRAADEELFYINRFIEILPEIETGKGTSFASILASFAERWGVKGIDKENLGNVEAARSAMNRLVLPLVRSLGHNPSNADLAFIIQALPNLEISNKGNEYILKLMKFASERSLAIAEAARDYKRADSDGNRWFQLDPRKYHIGLEDAINEKMKTFEEESRDLQKEYGNLTSNREGGSGSGSDNSMRDILMPMVNPPKGPTKF
tara:strand:- start:42 stop:1265 length:1224 start_codon:yes stop_codon:yes gene_type:complete